MSGGGWEGGGLRKATALWGPGVFPPFFCRIARVTKYVAKEGGLKRYWRTASGRKDSSRLFFAS